MSNQLTVTIDTNSRGELVARDPEGNAVAIRSSTCNPAALAQLIRDVEIAGHVIDWAESQVARPDPDDGTALYAIHYSDSGEFVRTITADTVDMETLSSDSAEGHFQANLLPGLEDLGSRSVYALSH